MRFFVHPINPHYAASHADDYFKGWQFGIWEHPYPAWEPSHYKIQSKTLDAAQHAKAQAELATQHLPALAVAGEALTLPRDVEPHSYSAAVKMREAQSDNRPIHWPWSDAQLPA